MHLTSIIKQMIQPNQHHESSFFSKDVQEKDVLPNPLRQNDPEIWNTTESTYPHEIDIAQDLQIHQSQNGQTTEDLTTSDSNERSQGIWPNNLDSIKEQKISMIILDSMQRNIKVAQDLKDSKSPPSKTRLLGIFLPKLRQFLIKYLAKRYLIQKPYIKQLLRQLPGMGRNINIKLFGDLLSVKTIGGFELDVQKLAIRFLNSHTSLLDILFPLQTKNGKLRKNHLEKKSGSEIISFLSTYQMLSKFHQEGSPQTFQNIWYYQDTQLIAFNDFDVNG